MWRKRWALSLAPYPLKGGMNCHFSPISLPLNSSFLMLAMIDETHLQRRLPLPSVQSHGRTFAMFAEQDARDEPVAVGKGEMH
jgi:hypothetical protein